MEGREAIVSITQALLVIWQTEKKQQYDGRGAIILVELSL